MNKEIKKNVKFIMPLVNGFLNIPIQKSGYDVENPYYGNSFLLRVFRELHFRLGLPFQSIWFNKKNIIDKKILFLAEALLTPKYIEWLHRKNPNSRIFILYGNKVNKNNNPNRLKRNWCSIWTTDLSDSEKYGLNFYGGLAYFSIYKVKKEKPKYDVFYVGKDKNRLEILLELEKSFTDLGLKTYFHITPARRWFVKSNEYYKPFIPYEKILKYLGQSKAILHLAKGAQTGITMRVMESLVYKIKLITDCKELIDYDFYNPNNIFILGKDDINKLPEFLNMPYRDVKSKLFNHMYFEDMVIEIINNFNKK